MMELVARIEAVLRRRTAAPRRRRGSFAFGDVRVDFRRAEVTRGGAGRRAVEPRVQAAAPLHRAPRGARHAPRAARARLGLSRRAADAHGRRARGVAAAEDRAPPRQARAHRHGAPHGLPLRRLSAPAARERPRDLAIPGLRFRHAGCCSLTLQSRPDGGLSMRSRLFALASPALGLALLAPVAARGRRSLVRARLAVAAGHDDLARGAEVLRPGPRLHVRASTTTRRSARSSARPSSTPAARWPTGASRSRTARTSTTRCVPPDRAKAAWKALGRAQARGGRREPRSSRP